MKDLADVARYGALEKALKSLLPEGMILGRDYLLLPHLPPHRQSGDVVAGRKETRACGNRW
jgi:hypothetical protein